MTTLYKSVRCLKVSDHHIDLQDPETSDLIVLYHMHFKSGLANFRPQEGHIIRKDWPQERTCVYIHRGGGIELTIMALSYSVFWMIPRCLNFMYRRFGTLCSIFICGVNRKNNLDEIVEVFIWESFGSKIA
jgi:hypothetical protein